MKNNTELSLDGKLFVVLVGLITLSYVKLQIEEGKLFKQYTLQSLQDEFDVIECFEWAGNHRRWGEMTQRRLICTLPWKSPQPRYMSSGMQVAPLTIHGIMCYNTYAVG